jgi:hypothetical protein
LILNDGLEFIDRGSFCNCTSLKGNLVIPDTVLTINKKAFRACYGLKSLKIGNSLTIIGEEAFYECKNLSGMLDIPNNVISIEASAFAFTKITGVKFGNFLEYIEHDAFCGCHSLAGTLIIPKNVKKLAARAFNNCKNLTEIVIEGDNVDFGYGAFQSCNNVQSITWNGFTFTDADTFNNSVGSVVWTKSL